MSDSEEDDTHLCLRCRQTFIGLDVYIRHRKEKCQKVANQSSHETSLPTFGINYTTDLDKSKHLDDNQKEWNEPNNKESRLDDFSVSRKNEILEPFLPETNHDNDPSLKADDFFSFLELQSSKSAAFQDIPSRRGKETPSRRGKESTSGKSLPQCSFEDDTYNRGAQFLVDYEQTQTKKSYSSNECSDVVLNESQKSSVMFHSEVSGSSKQHDKQQDETESSNPESEEDDDEEFDTREPTGGKWKPGGRPWESNYWSPTTPPSTHTGGKWRPSPPSTHTGGKWKPSLPVQRDTTKPHDSVNQMDKKYVETTKTNLQPPDPPPSHTCGKWLPTRTDSIATSEIRKSGSQVYYWCGACNRKLSSRGIYEKHLKSDLHQKRTRQERQLDEDLMVVDKREDGKRVVKRTQAYLNSSLWSKAQKKLLKQESPTTVKPPQVKNRRRNGRVAIRCEVCQCRVWRHLIGKHLVSRFHCRRALSTPEVARRQVLDNIASIVRQAPFQCRLCKFYCESSAHFLQHWTSEFHIENDSKMSGMFCCSYCRYETLSTTNMYDHLLSYNHKEVIAVINRSVPIIIEKRSIIKCEICRKIFRFNFELRNHAKLYGHSQEKGTGSDKYQEKMNCSLCPFVSFSRTTLQRHLNFKHTGKEVEGKFFCTICDLQFDSVNDSKEHRSTQEHKYKALKKHKKAEDLSKCCPYCFVVFSDVLALKKHLKTEHPDMAYRCARCGLSYSLKQELSRHIRTGCTGLSTDPPLESTDQTKNQCTKCAFTSTSETELLFHSVFHNDPLYIQKDDDTAGNCVAKYQCPSCPGLFLKHSLKNHIRSHTGERPYACKLCDASFTRKDVLANHMFSIHSVGLTGLYKKTPENVPAEKNKNVLCAECGASFYNKPTLQQHMQIHKGKNFKCSEQDCVSSFRSAGELKMHMKKHSDERPFQCDQCNYSSKTKAQLMRHTTVHMVERSHKCPYCNFASRDSTHLNRHLRLHTGARPFHCPHCSHTCNLLENLRKHVLSTKKHPGKSLYTCKEKDCDFATNLAKDFRVHLVKVHGQLDSAATSYISGLYRSTEDPRHIDQPITVLPRKKSKKTVAEASVEIALLSSRPSVSNINPTLASAALARGSTDMIKSDVILQTSGVIEPSDDVIYIQLPPDDTLDGYDTGVHFFSPGDGFLSNPDMNQRTLFFENLSRNRTISLEDSAGEGLHPLESDNRGLIVIDEVIEPVTTSSS